MGTNRTEFSVGRAREVNTTTTKTIIRIFKTRRPWTCIDALVFLQNAQLSLPSRRGLMVWIISKKTKTYLNFGPSMEPQPRRLTSFCTKDPRAPSNGNKPGTRINYNHHRSGSNPRSLALNEAARRPLSQTHHL